VRVADDLHWRAEWLVGRLRGPCRVAVAVWWLVQLAHGAPTRCTGAGSVPSAG